MATWQHDLRVVPRDEIAGRGFVPGQPIPRIADRKSWWLGREVSKELDNYLRRSIKPLQSWAIGWTVFGSEDGNRIDVIREGTEVDEIKARLDARVWDVQFAEHLVAVAKLLNAVFLT